MTDIRLYFAKNDGYQTILYSLIAVIFMNIYNTYKKWQITDYFTKNDRYQTILYSLIAVIKYECFIDCAKLFGIYFQSINHW